VHFRVSILLVPQLTIDRTTFDQKLVGAAIDDFALIENEHRIRQAVRGIRDMLRRDGQAPRAAA